MCLLAMLLASPAPAQEARGTIQGRVTDESGGVVPGARVDVTNVATGVVTDTTSNEQGSYRVPFLIPGRYRVAVSLDGFGRSRARTSRFTWPTCSPSMPCCRRVRSPTRSRSVPRPSRSIDRRRASARSSTHVASPSCRFARAAPSNWSSSRQASPTRRTCARARPRSTTACRSSRAMAPARSATTSRSTAWPTSQAIALRTARRRRPSRSSRSRPPPTMRRSATPWVLPSTS